MYAPEMSTLETLEKEERERRKGKIVRKILGRNGGSERSKDEEIRIIKGEKSGSKRRDLMDMRSGWTRTELLRGHGRRQENAIGLFDSGRNGLRWGSRWVGWRTGYTSTNTPELNGCTEDADNLSGRQEGEDKGSGRR